MKKQFESTNLSPTTDLQQLLTYTVFLAAFLHRDNHQLEQTEENSVIETQRELFYIVRALYHANTHQKGNKVLIQTALILSFWSPYDASFEVNTFWADEAMHHAFESGCFTETSTASQLVIGWCCTVRNRTAALGLHRPRLIFKIEPRRMLVHRDFPCVVERSAIALQRSKRRAVDAFILLCRLSDIMIAIADYPTKIQW